MCKPIPKNTKRTDETQLDNRHTWSVVKGVLFLLLIRLLRQKEGKRRRERRSEKDREKERRRHKREGK